MNMPTSPTAAAPALRMAIPAAIALLSLSSGAIAPATGEDRPTKKLTARAVERPATPTRSAEASTEIANNESFTASTNGSRFRHGENLVITVKAKKDGYIRILGFDDSGQTVQIFPNDWDKDNRMVAGRTIQIPSPELAGDYDLFVSVPQGKSEVEEAFQIIFSPEQFQDKDLTAFEKGSFAMIGKTDHATRVTKGLTARAVSKVSEKTFPYVVKRD